MATVLFVCVSNRGKSVMAEALARTRTGLTVSSAGTEAKLGATANAESAAVLSEVGADVTGHRPRQLTDELMRSHDVTVVVGNAAQVDPPDGVDVEVWAIDEPTRRGIHGLERMRLIRDEITERVDDLERRLGGDVQASSPG